MLGEAEDRMPNEYWLSKDRKKKGGAFFHVEFINIGKYATHSEIIRKNFILVQLILRKCFSKERSF